ncbi:MAG: DUF1292 domain-containing protein [Ruminococcus sp.]|nr:DUF1292 domain-containing protein [Ruminococcus sp.]
MMNNNNFEQDMLTLENDLGETERFAVLDVVEFEGLEYLILNPENEESFEQEIVILQIRSVSDDEEEYVGIEDEELLEAVFQKFQKRHKDEFDFSD